MAVEALALPGFLFGSMPADLESKRCRLCADPVSTHEIMEALEKFMLEQKSRDLQKLVMKPFERMTFKTSPAQHVSGFHACASLLLSLKELSPNMCLPPKNTSNAIRACHMKSAVHGAFQNEMFYDECGSLLRKALGKIRELQCPDAMQVALRKATSDEAATLKKLIPGKAISNEAASLQLVCAPSVPAVCGNSASDEEWPSFDFWQQKFVEQETTSNLKRLRDAILLLDVFVFSRTSCLTGQCCLTRHLVDMTNLPRQCYLLLYVVYFVFCLTGQYCLGHLVQTHQCHSDGE